MEGSSFYSLPTWDSSSSSLDHLAGADLLHSSIVSPPDNNPSMIRELLGRLGTICNSSDSCPGRGCCSCPNSAVHSSYATPLNSPPQLGLSMIDPNSGYPGGHLPLPADSGFVERAARLSCFGGRHVIGGQGLNAGFFTGSPLQQVERAESGRFSRVSSSQDVAAGRGNGNSPEDMETGDSPEGSSISEQILRPSNANCSRKRKFVPRGKPKESAKAAEDCGENERSGEKKHKDDNVKPPEPPKDYIHVRARRGQATDSHSLAERVRREKISQRMKVLQDLVPGCNKVTGKAVMLDEIINYVQSLQRQVEFLSMKLSTLNPRTNSSTEALMSKEVMSNPPGSSLLPGDSSSSAFPYGYQTQLHDAVLGSNMGNQFPLNALNVVAVHPGMDGFREASSTGVQGLWDDELHSIVQMGLPQNQTQHRLQASVAADRMKIES